YRIGGDEFVVILEDDKVSLSKYFVAQFKSEMEHKISNESLALWEKVSAAVGLAIYEPDKDKNVDEVFKRADKEMYANKLAMKATRTD
ncbi:MAG: diguanylate cyclase, partial [Selenomonadaceae bacterium]|nr:diguanylate cyclase [Selenomonadaceae bacterium]